MSVAFSDQGTLLYHSATGAANSFSKLVGITDAPAMGSSPAKIEVTELDMTSKAYIPDRVDIPDLEFNYNYNAANWLAVKTVADGLTTAYFMLILQDGSGFVITGIGTTFLNEVALGGAVTAKLTIVATDITDKTSAEVDALTLGS